jgi:polysaccharide pyruvyl transferase WcaK-like protein
MANLFTRFKNIPSKFLGNKLTKLNDISKGERVVKSAILQFYSANRNIGNYTPVLGIHQMLGQELDLWNIHKTPVDWDFVHKNYTEVIVGGAGLLHSVFEKFWVDLDKNCKLPITIWGIGVCLPDNDSVKGVPKAVVQSVFAKAKLANVRDELTRDFYQLDPKLSITACPTLVYIANNFKVADKQRYEKKVLHSSHVDLEPTSTTPQIKEIIKSAGYKYLFTENIETKKEGLKKILKMYQDCDYVVTTRLHGAIIAYAFKRPYIAISFDPKITAFNQLYGGGICISDVNQLAEALASEKFKVKSNYQRELDRVAEFGAVFRSNYAG